MHCVSKQRVGWRIDVEGGKREGARREGASGRKMASKFDSMDKVMVCETERSRTCYVPSTRMTRVRAKCRKTNILAWGLSCLYSLLTALPVFWLYSE